MPWVRPQKANVNIYIYIYIYIYIERERERERNSRSLSEQIQHVCFILLYEKSDLTASLKPISLMLYLSRITDFTRINII